MAFSRGASVSAQLGSILANTLYVPMNERRPWTVSGGLQVDRTETLCGLAVRQPWVHTHPRIVVDQEQTIVLEADSRGLHVCRAFNTLLQFSRSSSGEVPPQYKSSTSVDTKPAWI